MDPRNTCLLRWARADGCSRSACKDESNPMFIEFGSPRSGTTLLASTLDLHPDIVIPDETDFIIPAAFLFDRVKDEAICRRLIRDLTISTDWFSKSIGEYLTAEETARAIENAPWTIHGVISSVYDAMAQKSGARLAGDKSPNDLMFLRILVKTGFFESDVRMLHIVRDVRDVIRSLKRQAWAPPDIERLFPRNWAASNLYLNDLFATDPRYMLIRYEDMVREPVVTFRQVCDFLGVPFVPEMLSHEQRGLRYRQSPSHSHIASPFRTDLGRAASESGELIDELSELQAGEALRRFHYES
jgi:hypothetical protein